MATVPEVAKSWTWLKQLSTQNSCLYKEITRLSENIRRQVQKISKSSVQFSSGAQSCFPLGDPMDSSTPDFPVHHQLPELVQTHVHVVSDAIQPSRPLSSPSPPAFNLSQHQGLFPRSQFFTSGDQSIGVSASASVLPMNIQDWFPLGLTGWISLQSKRLSRVFSSTPV